jgi:oxygen-independent coproporphyrinogen-3 oxidase
VYSLTIEEKTVFGNWYAKGKLQITDDDESARQFEFIINQLEQNGYEQYEISNFSRAGSLLQAQQLLLEKCELFGHWPGGAFIQWYKRQFNCLIILNTLNPWQWCSAI